MPKRLIGEYQPSSQGRKIRKIAKIANCMSSKLWRLIKRRKKVKIHFKGYGHDTNEWRDYDEDNVPFEQLEKVYVPKGRFSLGTNWRK